MNTVMDDNQAPITAINNQTTKKMVLTDLEPISFCPEVTTSSQINYHVKGEQMATTKMVTLIRVPCRARGVCDTHTPSNAYFEIPEDCQHGKLLACSHKLCRDSSRRFRYCKTCDQVTAKRNFTKRHAHGIKTRLFPIDVSNVSNKKRKVFIERNSGSLSLANVFGNAMVAADDGVISDYTSESASSTVHVRGNTNADPSGSKLMMITRQEEGLLELVRNRPNGNDKLATDRWIQHVLDATSSNSHKMMMEDDILTDDEEEDLVKQPPMRMQSLDNFDIFTQSFECLLME